MKTIKLYLIALFLIVMGTSCEDEDYTGKAKMEPVSGISASVDASAIAGTYQEADGDTLRVTVTLSDLQKTADAVFYAIQTGGEAILGEDAEFINEDGYGVAKKTIPAGSGIQTVTWSLVILDDCIAEGTETLELQFGDARTANVDVNPATASISIANFRSEVPEVIMEWGTNAAGEELGVGGLDVADIDLDLFIVNEDLTAFVGQSAATGGNPEFLTFAAADGSPLANGTYYLYIDFYSSFDLGPELDPIEFPVFFNFNRCGGELNSDAIFTGFDNNGYQTEDGYVGAVIPYVVTVNDGNITINDGTVDIASGKIEKLNELLANAKK
ncbi:hypothetical protein QYS49_38370 [Marivirga salinae]|uniref:Calx-beta domain-containing protein n=1 Tax=Marivirga salinarum TaxID=3059078 RepID=A0AA51RED0_9BACT|nr:hypothetical protein [Marivirga sp. BDSF4-3]WMN11445.1 hypothetical protein QYS49_38370 [Marivirga sp. BDSF4-3]